MAARTGCLMRNANGVAPGGGIGPLIPPPAPHLIPISPHPHPGITPRSRAAIWSTSWRGK